LLCDLWTVPDTLRADLPEIALGLGADVPACLASVATRMRGIGDELDPVTLPGFGLMLVNPGRSVSTRDVFDAWHRSGEPGSGPLTVPVFETATTLAHWLRAQANDLQMPALQICPEIGEVLQALEQTARCLIARMSGSGATCFALYPTTTDAARAAASLSPHPWWCWGG
jgi:4-diphosphocytidyl-2-C-methyl-D-erythritol kinase